MRSGREQFERPRIGQSGSSTRSSDKGARTKYSQVIENSSIASLRDRINQVLDIDNRAIKSTIAQVTRSEHCVVQV